MRRISANPTGPPRRHPCKSFVKEKKVLLTRATEERALSNLSEPAARTCASRRVVPAFAEPDIHSLSQILTDRHRRLSVCSLPVLKQSGESLGNLLIRRSVGNRRTWQSARCVILLFFAQGAAVLCRRALGICEGYEVALPAIHGEQIRHHLPSYG